MRALVFIAVAACGYPALPKLGGDGGGSGDGSGSGSADAAIDAAVVASCMPALTTCGANSDRDCCDTKLVPGGSFLRGNDAAGGTDTTYKSSAYAATVPAFHLDTYQVTVARFRVAVQAGALLQLDAPADGSGAHADLPGSGWSSSWNSKLSPDLATMESNFNACGSSSFQTWTHAPGANEDLPINCVTWYQAFAFCIWDGGYLPTEAELHYAQSGGGDQRVYPWSSPASSTAIDCSYANIYYTTTAPCFGVLQRPGAFPLGDGKWGHADLGGNVAQWALDQPASAATYITPCANDCLDTSTSGHRVYRGGSYFHDISYSRSADRNVVIDAFASPDVGIRCARP